MVERSLSHARGTGIDTPHLQIYIFTNNCRNYGICEVIPTETNKPLRQRIQKKQGNLITQFGQLRSYGDVAQMVERSLRMQEVRGSIPRISKSTFLPTTVGTMGTVKFIPTETNKPEAKKLEETRQLDYQVWATGSHGDVAEMVERSLSMREVRGSIPRISKSIFLPTTVGTMGTVKSYRLRQTKEFEAKKLWGCKKQGNLIT